MHGACSRAHRLARANSENESYKSHSSSVRIFLNLYTGSEFTNLQFIFVNVTQPSGLELDIQSSALRMRIVKCVYSFFIPGYTW